MSKILKLPLIVISLISVFLLLLVYRAVAQPWQDPIWKDYGCPQDMLGTWVEVSRSDQYPNQIEFRKEGKMLLKGKDLTFRWDYQLSAHASSERYIELQLFHPESRSETGFLRIRPHKVSRGTVATGNEVGRQCSIKVFEFDNKKDMERNRYKTWKIYLREGADK